MAKLIFVFGIVTEGMMTLKNTTNERAHTLNWSGNLRHKVVNTDSELVNVFRDERDDEWWPSEIVSAIDTNLRQKTPQ